MTTKAITKAGLIKVIQSWGQGEISTEKLQLWMLDKFEPDEVAIGQGEPECVVEAMHIVMNEYELAKEAKCLQDKYMMAINYINCTEDTYNQLKNAFLRLGFCD